MHTLRVDTCTLMTLIILVGGFKMQGCEAMYAMLFSVLDQDI